MELSVIIPSSSKPGMVVEALHSCFKQDLFCESRMEVILVCDGNRDELLMSLTHFAHPNFRVLSSPLAGANAARAHGLRVARGNYVLFLDDDCRLDKEGHCGRVVSHLDNDSEIVGIGGYYRSSKDAPMATRYYNAFTRVWLWLYSDSKKLAKTKVLLGGNAAYRRSVVQRMQFNPQLKYGATESELHERLLQSGYGLRLCSDLSVRHAAAINYWDLVRKSWRQSYNRGRFAIRHDAERNYRQLLASYWSRGKVARRAFLWASPYLILGQFAYIWGSIRKGYR